MKIIHFCLSSFYIDNQLYQENELVRQHVEAGHEVLVIASTEVFDDKGNVSYCQSCEYTGADGAKVIRLPYSFWLPHFIASRLRIYPGVYKLLEGFSPDVIMFHGASAWELNTVANYVGCNPHVIFNIDSHADAVNSAHGPLSLEVLHKRFYAPILRNAMRFSGPLLCVSKTVMQFAENIYCVPRERIEFFPLGGRIIEEQVRRSLRLSFRKKMNISDNEVLIVQSGKQNKLKKLTSSLRAFAQVDNPNLKFMIVGILQDDIRSECERLIAEDLRVEFIGWQDASALTEILCAADVYLQPGTQSATMQHSLCCGCAVVLDNIEAHLPYVSGNGWLVSTENDLKNTFMEVAQADLEKYKAVSLELASNMLDYVKLAERILV